MTDLNVAAIVWLVLGVLLLIAELLGAAGFLLGAAITALALALIVWIFPDFGVVSQIVLFAFAGTISSYIYYRFFKDLTPKLEEPLNSPAMSLVGRRFELEEDLAMNDESKIQIGDTMWRVVAVQDLAKGKNVEVVGAKAMILQIDQVT